jgi:hypothetical protein
MEVAQALGMECPVKTYCINQEGVIQDKAPAIYVHQLCQGPQCIAWRWAFRHDDGRRYYKNGEGFCGLAGVP